MNTQCSGISLTHQRCTRCHWTKKIGFLYYCRDHESQAYGSIAPMEIDSVGLPDVPPVWPAALPPTIYCYGYQ